MAKRPIINITGAAEIAGYIKCQLLTGHYSISQKLPTADELARRFNVDPNTARAAYARLKAEGLVESTRGKGTFVKADIHRGQASQLSTLVKNAIEEASALGLSAEELATVIWLQKRLTTDRPRVWYVDNDFPFFDAINQRINELIGADALACSLGQLKDRLAQNEGPGDQDLVITSKFNINKVGELLGKTDPKLVPITPQLSPDTITRLLALPPEMTLGVVCVDQIFAEISGKLIERNGVSAPQLRGNTSDVSTLTPLFSGVDAITISTVALGRLKSAHMNLPDKPIVPFHYELTEVCEAAVMTAFNDINPAHAMGA